MSDRNANFFKIAFIAFLLWAGVVVAFKPNKNKVDLWKLKPTHCAIVSIRTLKKSNLDTSFTVLALGKGYVQVCRKTDK